MRVAAVFVSISVGVCVHPATGPTASDCAFDPGTGVMTVALGRDGDVAHLDRTEDGTIRIQGLPCVGGPTVGNTSRIEVGDTSSGGATVLEVDLALPFAPGAGPDEPDPWDEIEFDVDLGDGSHDRVVLLGTDARDHWHLGTVGINVNADEPDAVDDADLVLTGVERLVLEGRRTRDHLIGWGREGTGDPIDIPVTIRGQAGGDQLFGGAAGDLILGGPGNDAVLRGLPGDDVIRGGEGDDEIEGNKGHDRCRGGPGVDVLRSCEV